MTNKEFFIQQWENESKVTAKAFSSLPNDIEKLSYQHHSSFRSPWKIVNHIGPHAKELTQAVLEGKADLVNEGNFDIKAAHIYKTPEEAATDVVVNSNKLIEELKNCNDHDWEHKLIPVYWNGTKAMEMPLMQFCWMMFRDTLHHRGQLTSYYRIIGTVQPSLMGFTFEEETAMMSGSHSS